MNAKTSTQRATDFVKRQKEKGYKEVRIWMPPEKIKLLREIADAIKEGKEIVIHDATPDPDVDASEKG